MEKESSLNLRIEAAEKDVILAAARRKGQSFSLWARTVLEKAALDEILADPRSEKEEEETA